MALEDHMQERREKTKALLVEAQGLEKTASIEASLGHYPVASYQYVRATNLRARALCFDRGWYDEDEEPAD